MCLCNFVQATDQFEYYTLMRGVHQVARALQGHGLPVLQLPRGKNSGREMAAVMKSFTTSQEPGEVLMVLFNI